MTREPRDEIEADRIIEAATHTLDRLAPDHRAMAERLRTEEATSVRAASYGERTGGTTSDEFGALPDHADPTGDAGTQNAAAGSDWSKHVADLVTLDGVLARLSARHQVFMAAKRAKPPTDPDHPGDLWCRSHWRIPGAREPIDRNHVEAKLCRWCGDHVDDDDFPKDRDGLPPLDLLKLAEARPRRYLTTREVDLWKRQNTSMSTLGTTAV